jgi:hypothetical protein
VVRIDMLLEARNAVEEFIRWHQSSV